MARGTCGLRRRAWPIAKDGLIAGPPQCRRARFDTLEVRALLSVSAPPLSWHDNAPSMSAAHAYPAPAATQVEWIQRALASITTTGSQERIYSTGLALAGDEADWIGTTMLESTPFINLDDFQNDVRFAGIDGSGMSVVILDTGIDLDHPFFGPDLDHNGVADRIIYNADFITGDPHAQDVNGHGSNVSSIIASQSPTNPGMAPGVNLIHLQVLDDSGSGNFAAVESALQWVVSHVSTYNIVAVNMSLSDNTNRTSATSAFGIGDELSALAALNVIVVAAAGNEYKTYDTPGVGYPAADPNAMTVGAVWDRDYGGPFNWTNGASDYTTGPDRIASFSQRHPTLTDIFAPGTLITGAGPTGGTATFSGTSQAAPHVTGAAILAQQLAVRELGRRLTPAEFTGLLNSSGVSIVDGDDESDNVTNTGLGFKRIDVLALGNAIEAMGVIHVSSSTPASDQVISTPPLDFVINLSHPFAPLSVNPGDLLVNGIPANTVTPNGSQGLTFHYNVSPVTTQGLQTMAIAPGAITDAVGLGIVGFNSTFRYDAVPMQVSSAVPVNGSTVTLPLALIRLNLNEAYQPSSVGIDDLTLSQGAVTGFHLAGPTAIEYLLSGVTVEETLTFQLKAGAIVDSFGNPNLVFNGSYNLDIGTVALSEPWKAIQPVGSLIYETSGSGRILPPSDTDNFTIALRQGQRFSIVVTPDGNLRPTIQVKSPSGSTVATATSTAAGQPAILETVPATSTGTYTLTVGSAAGTSGVYTIQVVVNAAIEKESHGGATNNSVATAENIDSGFLDIGSGAARTAVLGVTDQVAAALGPDGFGYRALAVPATFEDIHATGAAILSGANNSWSQITAAQLGTFTFNFYGVNYNTLFVSSNGLITFTVGDATASNSDLVFSPISPAIAPLWDDLIISGAADSQVFWQVVGTGSDRRLIIEWYHVRVLGADMGDTITFQAVLREADGTIQFNYLDLDSAVGGGGANATVGIKDTGFQFPPSGDRRLLISMDSGPNVFVETGKSIRIGVGLVPSTSVDVYSLTLGTQKATLVVTAQSVGSLTLELLNASGAVLATGTSTDNASSSIRDFQAPAPGVYYARISGGQGIQYALVATRGASFDLEPNDTAGSAAQSISSTEVVLGATGFGTPSLSSSPGTLLPGAVDVSGTTASFGFASGGSFIGPTIGARLNGVEFLKAGQPLASYTVSINGASYTNGKPGTANAFPVTIEKIGTGSQHSIRIRGTITSGVLYERIVTWHDGDQYALVTTRITNNTASALANVALLENHDPDPGGDQVTSNDVRNGGKLVVGSTTRGAYGLASLDVRAVTSAEGFALTDPFVVLGSPDDPNGAAADLAINLAFNLGSLAAGSTTQATFAVLMGMSVAELDALFSEIALATLSSSDDNYRITVQQGHQLVVRTSTPAASMLFDGVGLDPAIELLDPNGVVVASDSNSAGDGRNAALSYLALSSGTYTVRIRAEGATRGEYVLTATVAPTATLNGPTSGVANQSLQFTLNAVDPSPDDQAASFTFNIDWDGNGSFDQSVVGPAGTQVSHSWSEVDTYHVRVRATDQKGATSAVAIRQIAISGAMLAADPDNPSLTNLIWVGSSGSDHVEFEQTAPTSVTVRTIVRNGVTVNGIQTFSGVTGRVIAQGGDGDDALDAQLLTTIAASLHGGAGKDSLAGGSMADTLVGGKGNDLIYGGNGNNVIYGEGDGGEGADSIIGGDGHDLIYADGAEGGNDVVYGLGGNDTVYAGGGNDFVDAGADDDLVFGGDGAEGSNDTLLGGAGNDWIDGDVGTDSLDGGTGRDVLVTGQLDDGQVLGDTGNGGGDDDILISGSLDFGPNGLLAAIDAVMSEWKSNRTYAQRVANLSGAGTGPRNNGSYFLTSGSTVLGNLIADTLLGGAQLDWFIFSLADDLLSAEEPGEIKTMLVT